MTETRAWWAEGEGHGLVWEDGIALLDPALDHEVVLAVWDALTGGADLAGFLRTLSQATGVGVLELPAFAVAIKTATGHGHLAARGTFSAQATVDNAVQSVCGDGVVTWLEARVTAPEDLTVRNSALSVKNSAETDDRVVRRPILAGVIPAGEVSTRAPAHPAIPVDLIPVDISAPVVAEPTPSIGPLKVGALPADREEPAPRLGDHDDATVLGVKLPSIAEALAAAEPTRGKLSAVLCSSGHANPQQRSGCRVCGAPLDAPPEWVTQPSLGQLVTSSGEIVELTGNITIGRDPTASRFQGPQIPRLLALPHPHVSANHLQIQIAEWQVLAVDLGSTNGTFLRRQGDAPFRMSETPTPIVSDDVLDLGHGVHLSFREIP